MNNSDETFQKPVCHCHQITWWRRLRQVCNLSPIATCPQHRVKRQATFDANFTLLQNSTPLLEVTYYALSGVQNVLKSTQLVCQKVHKILGECRESFV